MSKDTYERLRSEIVDLTLPPGSLLGETAIAARYGVSRTPVREALRRLEHDGLVERRDRSLVVRTCGPEEILEIYTVRIVLEGLAARCAAESRSELDLANLEERHLRMEETDVTDVMAMATTNRQFHEALWASSHNHTLVDLLTRLNSHLTRYPDTTLSSAGRWERALEDHWEMIEAIGARDAERAGKLAESHMSAARDIRLRMYASAGI